MSKAPNFFTVPVERDHIAAFYGSDFHLPHGCGKTFGKPGSLPRSARPGDIIGFSDGVSILATAVYNGDTWREERIEHVHSDEFRDVDGSVLRRYVDRGPGNVLLIKSGTWRMYQSGEFPDPGRGRSYRYYWYSGGTDLDQIDMVCNLFDMARLQDLG